MRHEPLGAPAHFDRTIIFQLDPPSVPMHPAVTPSTQQNQVVDPARTVFDLGDYVMAV